MLSSGLSGASNQGYLEPFSRWLPSRYRKRYPVAMTLTDFNGSGNWAIEAVRRRCRDYAHAFEARSPANLTPTEHIEGKRRGVYPVLHQIIEAIEKDDPAAIPIGIEFVEQDQHFPFGKILKSNTVRALRRASLSSEQEERIRSRIVTMLLNGRVPHEYKEYAKLLRRVGLGEWWPVIEEHVARGNRYVMRYYHYFQRHVLSSDASDSA